MTERRQPVCLGTNKRGELIWGFIPMPLWQQAMFPLRYCGDFIGFWIKTAFFDKTGHEGDPETPSMEIRFRKFDKKTPRPHSGD